jgi:chemotaxis protein MotB
MPKAAHTRTWTALGALCAAPLLLALGSCVAQETYDQAELTAKHYQDQAIRLEAELARLEDENRRMRAQLDAAQVQISEAGYTDDIDERLQNLRSILADLGNQPGDVSKIKVPGGYVYRVKDSVLFDLGSASVREDGKRVLEEVAADIRSQPFRTVYVRGHTDNLPVSRPETVKRFPHGNLQLSAARAVEVAAWLTGGGGVDERTVVVMGFGPNDPVAPNDSAENRQRNRRVDIFVEDVAPDEAR